MTAKHPVVMVVGDQDMENATVGLRRLGESQERRGVPVDEVVATLADEARPPSRVQDGSPGE